MIVSECLKACIIVLKTMGQEDPDGVISIGGEQLSYKETRMELKKLLGWVYKDLDTRDIQKITRCERCAYYKRFRKKGSKEVVYVCTRIKERRNKDYFCADAIPKED